MSHTDVLVVGAGLCGLTAASELARQGLAVQVIDKGNSVGGRLATRRLGGGRADHGAQFFTVRDPRFAEHVHTWQTQSAVFVWGHGWSDGSLAATAGDGHPRYAATEGMNALAKRLAAQLDAAHVAVQTDVRLVALQRSIDGDGGDGWLGTDEQGRQWHSRAVVLTPPVPQSLALLAAGGVELEPGQQAALAQVRYAPCVAALVVVEGEVALPAPGALQRLGDDIAWLADNRRKGISPKATVLTLHGSSAWSEAHYGAADEALLPVFLDALHRAGGEHYSVIEAQVKRWRYALPVVLHPERKLRAAGLPPLYFGGDAFGAPRVEGAFLSGLEIGAALAAEWLGAPAQRSDI